MGSGAPGPGDVEWLGGEEQARGRLRQALARRLATRGGRAAVALVATVAVTAAVTGAVLAWPDESAPAAASAAEERPEPSAEPQPSATRPGGREGHEPVVVWKVVRQFDDSVPTAPRFRAVRVVNLTTEPQRPTKIRLRGQFSDAPGLEYQARCRAPGRLGTANAAVPPEAKVTVVCHDLTEYGAREPRLDRSSIRVLPTMVPCRSGGSGGSFG